jgi:hypothetical protein
VVKVGKSKVGGTISQHSAVQPWLAADAHVNKTKTSDILCSSLFYKITGILTKTIRLLTVE